jgi:hypothetical protein
MNLFDQAVEDANPVAAREQFPSNGPANEPGAAGDQDSLSQILLSLCFGPSDGFWL